MKIAIVTAFYSEGMGYTENCLSRWLAALGHEVHVLTSCLNVYGNSADYPQTYQDFLGPAQQPPGSFRSDGFTVHRLESSLLAGYVRIHGLASKVRQLQPDIVHCTEIASLPAFDLAARRPFSSFHMFAETHQHMSVVKPFLREASGHHLAKFGYWLTRTLPSAIASMSIEKCYAIAPDCVEVAHRFYGVPMRKLKLQSLGTDTLLFKPCETADELADRARFRSELGFKDDDVVCVYTGRFTTDKNPLVLASAIHELAAEDAAYKSVFVGAGPQAEAIRQSRQSRILPFMKHADLARLYRACDIAVWPRQESMSMLDAAAAGLPLIVSDQIGESARVTGNGVFYRDNDVQSMVLALRSLRSAADRVGLSAHGRAKMLANFSWRSLAESIQSDYVAVRGRR